MAKDRTWASWSGYSRYGRGGYRSAAAKKGWETRRKNSLKSHVTTGADSSTSQQMHDQLQWIFDQVGKQVRRDWKDEYEYEDIVDVALIMAKTDQVFSKDGMEENMRLFIAGDIQRM